MDWKKQKSILLQQLHCGTKNGGADNLGSNTITLSVTDASGNTSSCNSVVTIIDNTAPIAICKNINLTLTNGIATLSPSQINNGSSDDCGIANMSISKTNFTCANNGANTVVLTVTDASGNSSTCSAVVTINTINYSSAGTNRIVYFGAPAPYNCATITASGTGGSGYTYNWSNGATTQNTSVCPTSSGTYYLTITDNQGCSSESFVNVCSYDVRCGNKNDKVQVCHNTNSSSNPTNDICISKSAVATHMTGHGDNIGLCSGTFTCGSSTAITPKMVVTGFSIGKKSNLVTYPNPASSELFVLFSVPTDQKVSIELYDLKGKLISKLYNEMTKENQTMEVSTSLNNLANGNYIVKMRTENSELLNSKIIILK